MEDCPWKEPEVYRAESREVPQSLKSKLSSWVEGFIDKSEADARLLLCQRWESIQHQELKSLASVLSEFSLAGISEFEEGGSAKFAKDDDQFFIPSPLPSEVIDSKLDVAGLSNVRGLRDFLVHFGGLAEAIDCAGSFRYSEEWPIWGGDPNVGNYGFPWNENTQGFQDWVGSLMFYHAVNGCQVLVRQDGEVAWNVMQERRIVKIASSLLEFVSQYVEHWKLDGFHRYDPYSEPHRID